MSSLALFSNTGSPMKVLRIVAAIVGGYTLTAVICHWMLFLLSLEDRDGQLLVNIFFYIIYLVVLMVLFCGANHRKVIVGTLVANAVLWAPWMLVAGGNP